MKQLTRPVVMSVVLAITMSIPLVALGADRDANNSDSLVDVPLGQRDAATVDVGGDEPRLDTLDRDGSDRDRPDSDRVDSDRVEPDRPDSDRARADRVSDRRPLDRCDHRVDNPRRCLTPDRPHDVNIRHLLWRLFKAHEWEKLVRLLIRLGLL